MSEVDQLRACPEYEEGRYDFNMGLPSEESLYDDVRLKAYLLGYKEASESNEPRYTERQGR